MASSDGEPEQRSRRTSRNSGSVATHAHTALKQQHLEVWHASFLKQILTPRTFLPLLALGIVLGPIGEAAGKLKGLPSEHFHTHFTNGTGDDTPKTCTLHFSFPNKLAPPLFFYRLTNFYQYRRVCVKSLDEKQLMSDDGSKGALGTCRSGKDSETYHMTNKGISWNSDRGRYGISKCKPEEVLPPPNRVERYGEMYTDQTLQNLHDIEEFQDGMRTAGSPMSNKLAMRNDSAPTKRGTYESILISTSSVLGGRNTWLGITYVLVSGILILLGPLFTANPLY
ncbi:hypothetical protein HOY82DRAFT_547317 [Tuber indicum]|nr:hypothetical protein HOY82DRAFT_547317 [Tuber indicum]